MRPKATRNGSLVNGVCQTSTNEGTGASRTFSFASARFALATPIARKTTLVISSLAIRLLDANPQTPSTNTRTPKPCVSRALLPRVYRLAPVARKSHVGVSGAFGLGGVERLPGQVF